MGIIKDLQAIGKILQKAGNIKLYEQLLTIQEKTLETMEENKNLKEKIENLKEKIKIKDSIIFEHDAYWEKDKEGNITGGPYCSKCYDSERKLMNLVSCGDIKYSECPICKKVLRIKYGKPWKLRFIENEGTPFDDNS